MGRGGTDEHFRRTFRVQFSSVPALEEFINVFKQVKKGSVWDGKERGLSGKGLTE